MILSRHGFVDPPVRGGYHIHDWGIGLRLGRSSERGWHPPGLVQVWATVVVVRSTNHWVTVFTRATRRQRKLESEKTANTPTRTQ